MPALGAALCAQLTEPHPSVHFLLPLNTEIKDVEAITPPPSREMAKKSFVSGNAMVPLGKNHIPVPC